MGNRGTHSSGGDKGKVADEEPAQAQRGVSLPFIFKHMRRGSCFTQRRAFTEIEPAKGHWSICIWTSAMQGSKNGENLTIGHQKKEMMREEGKN